MRAKLVVYSFLSTLAGIKKGQAYACPFGFFLLFSCLFFLAFFLKELRSFKTILA
jgi:drug/metabolite transporter superfamily protein YnfA